MRIMRWTPGNRSNQKNSRRDRIDDAGIRSRDGREGGPVSAPTNLPIHRSSQERLAPILMETTLRDGWSSPRIVPSSHDDTHSDGAAVSATVQRLGHSLSPEIILFTIPNKKRSACIFVVAVAFLVRTSRPERSARSLHKCLRRRTKR